MAADLRIAILEAFQEAGILIPSRQAEVTLQTIDLLRETAEYLSSDAHKTGSKPKGLLQGSLPIYQDSRQISSDPRLVANAIETLHFSTINSRLTLK